MQYDVAGRKVLITAGAGGIGAVTAREFLEQGACVFVCDVSEEAVAQFLSEHPKAGGKVCDVADEPVVGEMVAAAADAMGGLDVLVNNAGIAGPIAPLVDIDPEDWRRTIEVDLNSMFYTCRHAIPHIELAEHGVIVNISSVVGHLGAAERSPYAAAKSGVVGFSRALAVELGPKGICVNSILPGSVDGPRIRGTIKRHAKAAGVGENQMTEQYVRGNLLGTMQQPEEIAGMILYLSSPTGRSITGQSIHIDAGHQTLK
jgi:NAD(P)-dependent dehydrogenase (short-subunit alcohol dehydrogenase family)